MSNFRNIYGSDIIGGNKVFIIIDVCLIGSYFILYLN